jgi:hypothetical protein
MNLREILIFLFPFTTSEAYATLSSFIAATAVLAIIGAAGSFLSGRFVADRIGRAYGRSQRARKRKSTATQRSSVRKPTRYRADDPRRISTRDIRIFFLFLLSLAVLTGSIIGLVAASGDIARRDAVTGMYQILSLQTRPGGQGMIQAVALFDQQSITLFYQPSLSNEPLVVRARYRLEYLPRTRMLIRAVRLEPEG